MALFGPKFSEVHPTNSHLVPSHIMDLEYDKSLLSIHYRVHLGPRLESRLTLL